MSVAIRHMTHSQTLLSPSQSGGTSETRLFNAPPPQAAGKLTTNLEVLPMAAPSSKPPPLINPEYDASQTKEDVERCLALEANKANSATLLRQKRLVVRPGSVNER